MGFDKQLKVATCIWLESPAAFSTLNSRRLPELISTKSKISNGDFPIKNGGQQSQKWSKSDKNWFQMVKFG